MTDPNFHFDCSENDFELGYNELVLEEMVEIVKDGTKRNKELEAECKKKLASLFG